MKSPEARCTPGGTRIFMMPEVPSASGLTCRPASHAFFASATFVASMQPEPAPGQSDRQSRNVSADAAADHATIASATNDSPREVPKQRSTSEGAAACAVADGGKPGTITVHNFRIPNPINSAWMISFVYK